MNEATERKIGLALSGGGARAIAFHLGCLRALKHLGLLDRVSVLSTVSGGSVIGAYYMANHGDFSSFRK
jgi:NTE family protein